MKDAWELPQYREHEVPLDLWTRHDVAKYVGRELRHTEQFIIPHLRVVAYLIGRGHPARLFVGSEVMANPEVVWRVAYNKLR